MFDKKTILTIVQTYLAFESSLTNLALLDDQFCTTAYNKNYHTDIPFPPNELKTEGHPPACDLFAQQGEMLSKTINAESEAFKLLGNLNGIIFKQCDLTRYEAEEKIIRTITNEFNAKFKEIELFKEILQQ